MIVDTLKKRAQQEEALKKLEEGDNTGEIKKRIGKLTRLEQRKIRGGDKSIIL